jgi:hypothetical protein
MRILLAFVCVFIVLLSEAQITGKVMVSGTVIDNDFMPIQGVAIINVKTGKIARTDKDGFFQAEFSVSDSLLIYHIAYKKQFINSNDIRKKFVLEPEVFELKQVDVMDKNKQSNKDLDSMMISVNQLAAKKKLSGYDEKSQLDYFVNETGSHTKGFSPYFGPSFKIPFGKNINAIIHREEQRQIKEMTAHYHLVKPGK